MTKYLCLVAGVMVCGAVAAGAGEKPAETAEPTLRLGGSSAIAPLAQRCAALYQKVKGVRVTYQTVGSAKGLKLLVADELDVAATDAPVTADDRSHLGRDTRLAAVPLTVCAVVPAYNLKNHANTQSLKLSHATLAAIFLGRITRWNDPLIKAVNPDAALPNVEIKVIHRADGSGTTFIFSDYLARTSNDWKTAVGPGAATVKWPVGAAEDGNDSLAEAIAKTQGAIGYVELAYAVRHNLTHARVLNKAGEYVAAAPSTLRAARDLDLTIDPADETNVELSLTGAPTAYPILGVTWAVIVRHTDQDPRTQIEKARVACDFLHWAARYAQDEARSLNYVQLTPKLVKYGDEQLKKFLAPAR